MPNNNSDVSKELEFIYKSNGNMISPEKVVEFAKDKKTALHRRFEWNNTKAAHQYRLDQARHIIRYELIVIPSDIKEIVIPFRPSVKDKTRKYISLQMDRHPEGGYRGLTRVLSDKELREMFLDEAKREMEVFMAKYETLSELGEVFAAMDKVLKRKSTKKVKTKKVTKSVKASSKKVAVG